MKALTIRISADLYQRLQKEATKQRRSLTGQTEVILTEWFLLKAIKAAPGLPQSKKQPANSPA